MSKLKSFLLLLVLVVLLIFWGRQGIAEIVEITRDFSGSGSQTHSVGVSFVPDSQSASISVLGGNPSYNATWSQNRYSGMIESLDVNVNSVAGSGFREYQNGPCIAPNCNLNSTNPGVNIGDWEWDGENWVWNTYCRTSYACQLPAPYSLRVTARGEQPSNLVSLPQINSPLRRENEIANQRRTDYIDLAAYPLLDIRSIKLYIHRTGEAGRGTPVNKYCEQDISVGLDTPGGTRLCVGELHYRSGRNTDSWASIYIYRVSYENRRIAIDYRYDSDRVWNPNPGEVYFYVVSGVYRDITPRPPTITSFTASPTSIELGRFSTLSWQVGGTDPITCAASGAWSGSKPVSGQENVTPQSISSHTYTLSCSNAQGSDSKNAIINVVAPTPLADIKADNSDGPVTIDYATSATISWTSSNVNSCSVSPTSWTGTSGSQTTGILTSNQAYSLACTGQWGPASDSVSVNISGPTLSVTLSANPMPSPGTASPYTTTLTANAAGTVFNIPNTTANFSFWWDCGNPTNSVQGAIAACGNPNDSAIGAKFDGVSSQSQSATHSYFCAPILGQPQRTCTFRPKVIVEAGTAGAATNAITAVQFSLLSPNQFFVISKTNDIAATVSTAPTAESTRTNLNITTQGGFCRPVSFSVVSGLPSGATPHFQPQTASPNSSCQYSVVQFWLTVPRTINPNITYDVAVRGQEVGGQVQDDEIIRLNVQQILPEFREI